MNTRLTAGGGVHISGSKIKIAGDNPANGISLINQATEAVTTIPATAILTNEPSKISFVVPADLPAGDYKLRLTTQFSTAAQTLKEPRSALFDYVLAAG